MHIELIMTHFLTVACAFDCLLWDFYQIAVAIPVTYQPTTTFSQDTIQNTRFITSRRDHSKYYKLRSIDEQNKEHGTDKTAGFFSKSNNNFNTSEKPHKEDTKDGHLYRAKTGPH